VERIMTEPSLALQTALRARLIASPAVTALVPAEHIFDGATRPEAFPSIIIGDGQVVLEGDQHPAWRNVTVYCDLHVWALEAGLATVKAIAGAVWDAIGTSLDVPGFLLSDGVHVTGIRFVRDPDGKAGHAVVSVEALIGWQP
jgi:hypothetical protein